MKNAGDCGVLVVPNLRSNPILPVCVEVDEEAYKLNSKEAPKRAIDVCVPGIKNKDRILLLNFPKSYLLFMCLKQ